MGFDPNVYRGKRVLVTGHTGFKGSWLCKVLSYLGAEVTGFSLEPPTTPSLFDLARISRSVRSVIGDIRDLEALRKVFTESQPEIVFHLAAQPLVRESYRDPVFTYETNVMGTVNLLECVRQTPSVKSVLNVTTDKVYRNREWVWGYREEEELDGFDPYSNSKSCSELVTAAYRRSFFANSGVAISTARAGNVIGGGDFAKDRILPDCIRSAVAGETIRLRNPHSIRPYQHVLEPVFAYLMIAAGQLEDPALAGSYNVGPDEADCSETGALVDVFTRFWGNVHWEAGAEPGPHEANFLKLDCAKLRSAFGWHPRWDLTKAVEETVRWSKCYVSGEDVGGCMEKQIKEFLSWESFEK